jgi:hypothetical protein
LLQPSFLGVVEIGVVEMEMEMAWGVEGVEWVVDGTLLLHVL